MGWPVLLPLMVVGVMLGVVFGGIEVAAVAFTEELGSRAASGPLLAVLAVGSGLAGLLTGAVHWRSSTGTRFRIGTVALAVAALLLPFVEGFALMGAGLFFVGIAVSPILISSVAWIEETVPPRRLTEGISITTTGLYVGLAPGAALVGAVVDRAGASASFWVPAGAAVLGALVGLTTLLVPTRPVTAAVPSPSGSSE
jgi:predicted MFS family arabinose efflux permease